MKPFRVRNSYWTPVFWGIGAAFFLFGALFFLWIGVMGLGNFSLAYAIISLVFAHVLAGPFLLFGPIEMNDEYIQTTLPLGRFEISWDEVQSIERSPYDAGNIVFRGENKRLVIHGTAEWVGAEKEQMFALLMSQIKTRDIPIKRTTRADWQLSRGTKVKEF